MANAPSLPPSQDALFRRLAQMEAKMARLERNQRAAQLAHSSVENGTIAFRDAAGNPQIMLGLQVDGTHAVVGVSGRNPEQPSDPLVSAGIGGLYVIWDGTMATGQQPLSDFAAVQVHVSQQQGFTPGPGTLQGTLTTTGMYGVGSLSPGAVYYVALVTMTISGVAGPSSNQVQGTPASVPDNIPAGSITGQMIGNGAVTGQNIAANTIAAAHLAAGIIVAGIVDATTITGAQFIVTGTSGEFLAYNGPPGSGNLVMSLSPVAGTDQYGNAYPAGVGLFGNTSQIVWPGGTAPTLYALGLLSGASSYLVLGGNSGTTGKSVWISPAGLLTAQDPASGILPETWHNFTGQTNWTAGTAQYALLPAGGANGNGGIAFKGKITTPGVGGPNFNGVDATLPLAAAYQPASGNARRWTVNLPTTAGTATAILGDGSPITAGAIQFQGLPGSFLSGPIDITGTIWL